MPNRRAAVAPRRSVLVIGSEANPFSKTGGLADVLGALPSALARLGWNVTLAVPRYRGVPGGAVEDRFVIKLGGISIAATFHDVPLADGARALLIDAPELFDRQGLYGVGDSDYSDNPRRFAFLVRAALEFVAHRGVAPSVVHAHDWQAGLAPVYLKTLYAAHPTLGGLASVFTIHNLAYQGLFEPDWLPRLDLPWQLFAIDQLEYWGKISFLKGGINAADALTTVSPTYAAEIQTPELGFGFDGILRHRTADLFGILNGIDVETWNPANDQFLPMPFSLHDLSGKRQSKREVLAAYGIGADEGAMARPLVGMISRMVPQKGLDLIAALADDLPKLDATFVILGTGDARYQEMWTGLAARHPQRIGVRIGFDEPLAHVIEGGADMFLMPSHFEPCGLNQMYSLRYGTVPIVRAVGGLADTVFERIPPDQEQNGSREPNGFVFRDYTPGALLEALQRAIRTFHKPEAWRALQVAGMKRDHSWDRSAREYVKIYERAIASAARRRGSSPLN